ncbi:MAG: AAA family ATPase [Candidatus Omnitrophica bacterium]|nr:AAA family ATPase [Candidatus Omnitrophota bacterium]
MWSLPDIKTMNAEAVKNVKRTPKEIYAALDEYVIGQNEAKMALSVAVHRHYHQLLTPNCKISPANILLIGPTGVGKTHLVRTLADILQVPVAFVSANDYSETGYIGRSVGDMVRELYLKASENRGAAEHGIIFIDEIDKLAANSYCSSDRDVSGRSVQEELLDLLESGGLRKFSCGFNLKEEVELDASKILFIAAGAFDGLNQAVREKHRRKSAIGFSLAEAGAVLPESVGFSIEPADLDDYGLIPELLGRFSVICSLVPLSRNDLVRIMVEPEDSILKEYQEYLHSFGVEIKFQKRALEMVAEIAQERNTGARGLRSVLEKVLQPYFFGLEDNQQMNSRIIIDEKTVQLRLRHVHHAIASSFSLGS